MPTLVNPYCLLADVQQECRNFDTTQDPTVVSSMQTAINNASRWIDEYCRRDFLYHDWSANGTPIPKEDVIGKTFWMRWPIVSISSVSVDGTPVDPSNYFFDIGKYEVEYYNSLAGDWFYVNGNMQDMPSVNWLGYNYPGPSGYPEESRRRPTPIIVQGIFGYAPQVGDTNPPALPPQNVPWGVNRACVLIAAAWSGQYRVAAKNFDGSSTEIIQRSIPPEAMKLLAKWQWKFI